MKKLLMWAVGVPFLVTSMVMLAFVLDKDSPWTGANNAEITRGH